MTALLAAGGAVSGGISLFGIAVPAAVVIAFVLGLIIGKKFL
jgi:hypothetical protein